MLLHAWIFWGKRSRDWGMVVSGEGSQRVGRGSRERESVVCPLHFCMNCVKTFRVCLSHR